MEKKLKVLSYKTCTPSELPETDKSLVEIAKEASEKSYAPYSNFKVGCAVLLEDRSIYAGSNQENASSPCGTCAERTALYYANAEHPESAIKRMVIVAQRDGKFTDYPVSPCGLCRQAMLESENRYNRRIHLTLYGEKECLIFGTTKSLLPFQFDAHDLLSNDEDSEE